MSPKNTSIQQAKTVTTDRSHHDVYKLLSVAYYFIAELFDYNQRDKKKFWYLRGIKVAEKVLCFSKIIFL